MECEPLKTTRRAACLFLCLLVFFLSYRPLTSLLAIAGVARNPTEGRCSTGGCEAIPRENMPRPAKAQHCDTQSRLVERAQKSKSITPEEKALQTILLLSLWPADCTLPSQVLIRAEGDAARPEYMRLFRSGNPGMPNSPPA